MEEIWKDIDGYEGYYQVSNLGRVKSLKREVIRSDGHLRPIKECILTPIENNDGYYQIKLSMNGKSHTKRIHQLVGLSFLDKPNDFTLDKYEINHIDCDRKNNDVNNLEWITHGDNVRYSIENNNHVCTRDLTGDKNPNYGNHTLSNYYRANPDKAIELLSRRGSQNGRSVAIELYDIDMNYIKTFDWIGGCAEYLILHNISKSKNVNTLRTNITSSIKNNKPYLNHYFKKAI